MQYETMTRGDNYLMGKAVIILRDYGHQIFDNFCNEHDFSFCDINRCIAKCKISYNRADLQEYQLPDNLKQKRWQHYTDICRYSQHKARQLLRAVDESYENQFMPKIDSEMLTGGIKHIKGNLSGAGYDEAE